MYSFERHLVTGSNIRIRKRENQRFLAHSINLPSFLSTSCTLWYDYKERASRKRPEQRPGGSCLVGLPGRRPLEDEIMQTPDAELRNRIHPFEKA